MNKKKVLFIDDEFYQNSYMAYYSRKLKSADLEVVEAPGPDEALEKVSYEKPPFDFIILDLMMPPGKTYEDKDTLKGLRTGILLARTLREKCPQLPIFVLTSLQGEDFLSALNEIENTQVYYKLKSDPEEFANIISQLLNPPKTITKQKQAVLREAPPETIYEDIIDGTIVSVDDNTIQIRFDGIDGGTEIRQLLRNDIDECKYALSKNTHVRVRSFLDVMPPSGPMTKEEIKKWHKPYEGIAAEYPKKAKRGPYLLKNGDDKTKRKN